jgi:hypothetical protein
MPTKKDLMKTIERMNELISLNQNAFRVIYENCISNDAPDLKLSIIKKLSEIHKGENK